MRHFNLKDILAATLLLMAMSCTPTADNGDKVLLSDGWTLSREGTEASYKATVPSTVAGVLYDNGYYTDESFKDDNYASLDKSIFDDAWLYRKSFKASKVERQHAFLDFDGLNFYADIYVNGRQLCSKDTTFGVFNRYSFDITELLGSDNMLEVRLEKAQKGDLNVGYVDWNPRPVDASMGIWRDVTLCYTGDVRMRDLFVHPVVSQDLNSAELTVSVTLENLSSEPIEGNLSGLFENGSFSVPVSLEPDEVRQVTVSSEQASDLHIDNPRLWWCSGLGSPELYNLSAQFTLDDGTVSDKEEATFGIRNIDSYLDENDHRQFVLNGKKVLIKGAGWTDDIFMRDTHESVELQVRYVKDMNLNCIRFENIWGKDRYVYDMCDKYGLLAMVGWSCQWEWEAYCGLPETNHYGCITTPETMDLAYSYFINQCKWLRNNVSVIGWVLGSDCLPYPELEKRYLAALDSLDYRPYIGSAKNLESPLTGLSGTKMDGPYEYVGPDYWYLDTDCGGAFGFNTETGIGANLPSLESLRKMVSEENLWPITSKLDCHATTSGSGMHDTKTLAKAIAGLYGEASDIEDFVRKGQAVDYDGTRAMFEAFRCNLPNTTGIVQWMLNSAWPSLYWQLYDHYMVPTGGYYGTKKACEPIQLIYNLKDAKVYAVNETGNIVDAVAEYKAFDRNSKVIGEESCSLTIADRTPLAAFDMGAFLGKDIFLSLVLRDAEGKGISDNFYCIPAEWNTYDWADPDWFVTRIDKYADLSFVTKLPEADVKVEAVSAVKGKGVEYTVTLRNESDVIAYQNVLTVKDGKGELVVPALWSDNYFALLPGETKTVVCNTDTSVIGTVGLKTWNEFTQHGE